MKLINIHIPKTAGSSISSVIQQRSRGVWLRNTELENSYAEDVWGLDYLSGHFTRSELLSWTHRNQLCLDDVRVLTVIRHPLDQLQSNLSFPFDLSARGRSVDESWMKEIISLNPRSANDLYSILRKHPWILNLQWQFLVTGSSLVEALNDIDHIAIYPDVAEAINYACQVLRVDAPEESVHENSSWQKSVGRDVFAQSPLRELILSEHLLDIQLYYEVISRRMMRWGLGALSSMHHVTPECFLDSWVSGNELPLIPDCSELT